MKNNIFIIFLYYICIIFILFFAVQRPANASVDCPGRFINPITDVCWSCLFPITIGNIPIVKSSKFKDTSNPTVPVCGCRRGNIPIVPGITVGFWEPIRVVEVVRTPYCLVSLGGLKVAQGKSYGGFVQIKEEQITSSKSFYHVHQYVYPVLAILNLLTDFGCMDTSSYDLAYISELDPSHTSPSIANFLHPETFLLSNPVAVAACAVDCVAATTTKMSMDSLFWCSGCQGSVYPFVGETTQHVGGIATSQLLVTKQLAKMHRLGLARKTATDSSAMNGELCKSSFALRIPKSQYRTQMVYPVPNVNGQYSCNTLGLSDALYSSGREFPFKGEDFVYILWRKRNCCLL
jgi:conjugal transfer pilus assembly protein TraU